MSAGASGSLRIEPLASRHDRDKFDSGVEPLDRYLKRTARQDARRYVAAPFVAVRDQDPSVLGYYTLAPTGVDLGSLPEETARKLPRYPIVPAILLGRLAVDRRQRGQRLGEALLLDAMERALTHADRIGGAALVVDAKDDAAARFYARYEFCRFPERADRLFLPMTVIAKLFA
jgi:predicted GNAT family N-acyltransferase